MTKVVHLTAVHPPFDIRIFHKECVSLAAAGFEVGLLVPHHGEVCVNGVRVHAVPQAPNKLLRMTVTVFQILRAALQEDADLYHFHDPELIPVGIFLKLLGKRVIYDVHENVPEDILTKDYLPPWVRSWVAGIAGKMERWGAFLFDGVVSVTPRICSRFPAEKTILIRNFPIAGELLPLSPVPLSGRPHALVYTGRISIERGLEEMIQAMALLPAAVDAKLLLAGAFTPADLGSQVLRRKGADRVDFRGWLSRDELRRLLAEARIGLALFRPGPNQTDSYPNKLFEYMAAGLPVIASDFPLWREIVENAGCGLLVNPLDPQAIAEAALWLLEHPLEASEMGRKGMAAVASDFNWANEANRLCRFYQKLLGSDHSLPPLKKAGRM